MRINGIDYGRIWAASGALGMFGEGYWYHKWCRLIPGFSTNVTFVAKTVTNQNTAGNMPLRKDWQPKERFPKCIWWNAEKGIALNAVGLSNFGMDQALEAYKWQVLRKPFMLSWMPIGTGAIEQAEWFAERLKREIKYFYAKVALQVNLSYPNTGEDLSELTKEAQAILQKLESLEIPLIPKFNVLTTPEAVAKIADKARVDGVVVSNTIPYGAKQLGIHWNDLVGDTASPLTRRGFEQPGGLSGHAIYPIVKRWVKRAEKPLEGLPINFCGGVDSAARVEEALSLPGVESVSVGTAFMLRPWQLKSMIRAARG